MHLTSMHEERRIKKFPSAETHTYIRDSLPEEMLLYALIERSILDLKSHDPIARRDAFNWFLSKRKNSWSFIWTCEALDIQANKIRALAISEYDANDGPKRKTPRRVTAS